MLGTTARKIVGGPLDAPELAWVSEGAPEGDGDEHELELDRDGTHRVVKVRVSPIVDGAGDTTGQVVALRDVTAEYEITQMKNEFVSTVSHELRTPLTSIKGYVDLIVDGDAGEINDVQREFLSIVQENSDRLVELINDMLDISRIESGRIHLKVEPHYVPDLVEGAVDTFRAVMTQSGRGIEAHVPDDLPLVAADRDRVRQVLINLVSNAIKYSPEGGDVILSAEATDGSVTISVRDHGLGISPRDQEMLFTKFYRVDSAMTREIGGTGLGLSICKSIIELLGGRIGVNSVIGEGSTFWFSLPVAPDEMIRLPEVSGPDGAKGTVLVIDSDPEVATLIETYLMRRGFTVYKAYNSKDALATAQRVKPHVITLDVILESNDGFELIQRFKELPETANTPVVVLSIICDEGRSCRFGAANYLEKPIDQERLFDVVGNLVGSAESPLILVVDDDRQIVGVLSETLRRKGYSVAEAYDGTEAIAALGKVRPHAILLDLRMPKMDGYEVIRRVKTHPEWGEIPIVVMTAHPIDSANTDLLASVAGQINKPISPDGIAAQVEQLLTSAEIGGPQ
jgi:signal transduction histidine kinase/CheY-like chemotaxis protein